MPRVSLPERSAYQSTPVYLVGGVIEIGLMRPPIAPAADDREYEVPHGTMALDEIAKEIFKDERLWWVLVCSNPEIIDPLQGLPAGTKLRVPSEAVMRNLQ